MAFMDANSNGDIIVNIPLGKFTVERQSDGSYSFLGMTARLVSAKKGVYTVDSSIGTWAIDTNK